MLLVRCVSDKIVILYLRMLKSIRVFLGGKFGFSLIPCNKHPKNEHFFVSDRSETPKILLTLKERSPGTQLVLGDLTCTD